VLDPSLNLKYNTESVGYVIDEYEVMVGVEE
jgi:hypothetical protein